MLQTVISAAIAALRSRKGISALEYGILAAVLVGAISAAAGLLSTDISSAFSTIGGKITTAAK
jgi:pilus assembly protein Flp/PilA